MTGCSGLGRREHCGQPASVRAEVCRLTAVHSCAEQLDLAAVHVTPDIDFERSHGAVCDQQPLAGRNERLGDVIRLQYR